MLIFRELLQMISNVPNAFMKDGDYIWRVAQLFNIMNKMISPIRKKATVQLITILNYCALFKVQWTTCFGNPSRTVAIKNLNK